MRARPRRRSLSKDHRERLIIAGNVFDRQFKADKPNHKWGADFNIHLDRRIQPHPRGPQWPSTPLNQAPLGVWRADRHRHAVRAAPALSGSKLHGVDLHGTVLTSDLRKPVTASLVALPQMRAHTSFDVRSIAA